MVAGLPHARGGVSAGLEKLEKAGKSSPRSWGCFLALDAQLHGLVVFPTLVGVFPTAAPARRRRPGLPHARGGVSAVDHIEAHHAPSSPRSWGCFSPAVPLANDQIVFPTLVGVFPQFRAVGHGLAGLPHARGGVSERLGLAVAKVASSPRSWGCFRDALLDAARPFVFPTLVGVFHRGCPAPAGTASLPHARGGVSATNAAT